MQSAGTVPKQVLLLLCQIVIGTVYREVVFLALQDKLLQPLSHHIAFPADYRSLEDGQAFIGHDQIFIYAKHLPEPFACRAGSQRVVEAEHHIGRLLEHHSICLELLGIFFYNRSFGCVDTDDTGIVSFEESRFGRVGKTAFQCLVIRYDQTVYQQFDHRGGKQCVIRQHFTDAVNGLANG